MYKAVSRIIGVAVLITIIAQKDRAIDVLTIFFIGGIIPFTDIAISTPVSILLIIGLFILVCLVLNNLRQSVLKRNAILYSASVRHKKIIERHITISAVQDNVKSSANMLSDTDDLKLVNS